MIEPYGTRLARLTAGRGPLCVGVDPHPGVLDAWGLPRDASGLERCARGLIEALGWQVAAFKPQSAFFEAYGSAGLAVLERTLADIAGAGALSVLDVKRGDVGSTMDAYASAYLSDGSSLAADAVTLSPYLGFGSLTGALDLAEQNGRGAYVLALTSNPEGPEIQRARQADGRTVAEAIVAAAAARNAGSRASDPDVPGPVGIVVGATITDPAIDFNEFGGSILVPGIGAQGGRPDDLARLFGSARRFVLPSLSREILRAGPRPAGLRAAADAAQDQLRN